MTQRIAMAAASAMAILCLAAACAQTPRAELKQSAHTNFTGAELAARIVSDVVTIENMDRHDAGTGTIIGASGDSRFVLTASHVIASTDDTPRPADAVSKHFKLTRCDPSQQQVSPLNQDARVVLNDPDADFAVLQVTSAPGDALEPRILSSGHVLATGAVVWAVGKGGSCAVGTGQIRQPQDQYGVLLADMAGGLPGTSGAPVSSGTGVIGIVLSIPGAAIVKIRSIDQIQRAIANRKNIPWKVAASGNLPPSSAEDIQYELNDVLNSYVFALKDMRDALTVELYTERDLAARVSHYNAAINRFNAVRDKFDGSLAHDWGPEALQQFVVVKDQIDDVHKEFLGFNASMDKLRKEKVVPLEIREHMAQLSPRVDALDAATKSLIRTLGRTP